jgi:hypothetical protein
MLTCANIRAMPERPGPRKPADTVASRAWHAAARPTARFLIPVVWRTTKDLELHMLIRALMAMTDHRKRMAVLSFITFASLC